MTFYASALSTLVVGVAILGVVFTDQSAGTVSEQQLIESEAGVGQRRVETPEVVLQLKYDRGELNRIYLTQFRKGKSFWTPSVPARTNLCSDLCHAGLGGDACGPTCSDLIPIGLQTALDNANSTAIVYGEPRVAVCPTLCDNQLGHPLCNCHVATDQESEAVKVVDWGAICASFCVTDSYVLGGCPSCEETVSTVNPLHLSYNIRMLTTNEGWVAWCNVQCRQGQGGAACNCDRAPFQ